MQLLKFPVHNRHLGMERLRYAFEKCVRTLILELRRFTPRGDSFVSQNFSDILHSRLRESCLSRMRFGLILARRVQEVPYFATGELINRRISSLILRFSASSFAIIQLSLSLCTMASTVRFFASWDCIAVADDMRCRGHAEDWNITDSERTGRTSYRPVKAPTTKPSMERMPKLRWSMTVPAFEGIMAWGSR